MGIINSLDVKEGSFSLARDEISPEKFAKDDWAKIILMEESSWRQKSRALWL